MLHPTIKATFEKIGLHGVSDSTTIGELTNRALQIKGGFTRRRKRNRKKSKRRTRLFRTK